MPRPIGVPNMGDKDKILLLKVLKTVVPIGPMEWKLVAEEYNKQHKEQAEKEGISVTARSASTLKTHFFKQCVTMKKPEQDDEENLKIYNDIRDVLKMIDRKAGVSELGAPSSENESDISEGSTNRRSGEKARRIGNLNNLKAKVQRHILPKQSEEHETMETTNESNETDQTSDNDDDDEDDDSSSLGSELEFKGNRFLTFQERYPEDYAPRPSSLCKRSIPFSTAPKNTARRSLTTPVPIHPRKSNQKSPMESIAETFSRLPELLERDIENQRREKDQEKVDARLTRLEEKVDELLTMGKTMLQMMNEEFSNKRQRRE